MTRTQFLALLCTPFVLPLLPKMEPLYGQSNAPTSMALYGQSYATGYPANQGVHHVSKNAVGNSYYVNGYVWEDDDWKLVINNKPSEETIAYLKELAGKGAKIRTIHGHI